MTIPAADKATWPDLLRLAYAVTLDLLGIGALLWIVTAPFWMTALVLGWWGRCTC